MMQYEQAKLQLKQRMKQLENDILRVRKDSERIEPIQAGGRTGSQLSRSEALSLH